MPSPLLSLCRGPSVHLPAAKQPSSPCAPPQHWQRASRHQQQKKTRLPAPTHSGGGSSGGSGAGSGGVNGGSGSGDTMLLEHLPVLAGRRIVLASASPRRRELMQQMGLQFEVVVSSFDESLPKHNRSAAEYAEETAACKALDVAQGCSSADVIIGADTVVECGSEVLEKPADAADAARMLRMLSGRRHHVHTGCCLVLPGGDGSGDVDGSGQQQQLVRRFSVTTAVEFAELSDAAIEAYISSGEPFGKAGSYGIQGLAGSFVRGIDGCYFNVMGLPIARLGSVLAQLVESGALPRRC